MELEQFIAKRPFLYHLTDVRNYDNIIGSGRLLSTQRIVNLSQAEHPDILLRQKRPQHSIIDVGGVQHYIRDQQPISEVVLARSLTGGWSIGDFLNHLNARVFMWPTAQRLQRHFDRYRDEEPIIFRFASVDVLELNPHAQFCRLNSGATRCSSHWGGNAPERGAETFKIVSEYDLPYATVAEVTFPGECLLPQNFHKASSPEGPWTPVQL